MPSFRNLFNERPHEALAMQRPADVYKPSTRPYRGIAELSYPSTIAQQNAFSAGSLDTALGYVNPALSSEPEHRIFRSRVVPSFLRNCGSIGPHSELSLITILSAARAIKVPVLLAKPGTITRKRAALL